MKIFVDILGLAVLAWPLTLLVLLGLLFMGSIWVARALSKNSKHRWRAPVIVFLCLYLFFFWDVIPALVAHKYYCGKEAGFWVYKTKEQWMAENPGVMEGLVMYQDVHDFTEKLDAGHWSGIGRKTTYHMNDRFDWVNTYLDVLPVLEFTRETIELVDRKTGEVLAKYVDIPSGGFKSKRYTQLNDLDFWMQGWRCSGAAAKEHEFVLFKIKFYGGEQ